MAKNEVSWFRIRDVVAEDAKAAGEERTHRHPLPRRWRMHSPRSLLWRLTRLTLAATAEGTVDAAVAVLPNESLRGQVLTWV